MFLGGFAESCCCSTSLTNDKNVDTVSIRIPDADRLELNRFLSILCSPQLLPELGLDLDFGSEPGQSKTLNKFLASYSGEELLVRFGSLS